MKYTVMISLISFSFLNAMEPLQKAHEIVADYIIRSDQAHQAACNRLPADLAKPYIDPIDLGELRKKIGEAPTAKSGNKAAVYHDGRLYIVDEEKDAVITEKAMPVKGSVCNLVVNESVSRVGFQFLKSEWLEGKAKPSTSERAAVAIMRTNSTWSDAHEIPYYYGINKIYFDERGNLITRLKEEADKEAGVLWEISESDQPSEVKIRMLGV